MLRFPLITSVVGREGEAQEKAAARPVQAVLLCTVQLQPSCICCGPADGASIAHKTHALYRLISLHGSRTQPVLLSTELLATMPLCCSPVNHFLAGNWELAVRFLQIPLASTTDI